MAADACCFGIAAIGSSSRSRARASASTPIFRGSAANPRFVSAPNLSPLATAVLEVKGSGDELPAALRPLLALGLHKRSFSKFLVVYAHMTRGVL